MILETLFGLSVIAVKCSFSVEGMRIYIEELMQMANSLGLEIK